MFFPPLFLFFGDIAQLARAAALQAVGQGFKSPYLHKVSIAGSYWSKFRFRRNRYLTITREGNEDAVVFETLQCSRKLKKDMKLLYFSEKRKKEGTIIWSSEEIGLWWMPMEL